VTHPEVVQAIDEVSADAGGVRAIRFTIRKPEWVASV
jgi:hypothetical protein